MVSNYKAVLYDNETLETDRLVLRKFKKTDISDILEYSGDKETLKHIYWEGAKTEEDAIVAITDYYWANPGVFAIELKENKKMIGCIDLRFKAEHEKAEFGYILNKKYWNKGYMSESLKAVLSLCFDKIELNRVESNHFVGNEASGRVMQKCGMKLEGIFRQDFEVKGKFRDTVRYAITRDDFYA